MRRETKPCLVFFSQESHETTVRQQLEPPLNKGFPISRHKAPPARYRPRKQPLIADTAAYMARFQGSARVAPVVGRYPPGVRRGPGRVTAVAAHGQGKLTWSRIDKSKRRGLGLRSARPNDNEMSCDRDCRLDAKLGLYNLPPWKRSDTSLSSGAITLRQYSRAGGRSCSRCSR